MSLSRVSEKVDRIRTALVSGDIKHVEFMMVELNRETAGLKFYFYFLQFEQ